MDLERKSREYNVLFKLSTFYIASKKILGRKLPLLFERPTIVNGLEKVPSWKKYPETQIVLISIDSNAICSHY